MCFVVCKGAQSQLQQRPVREAVWAEHQQRDGDDRGQSAPSSKDPVWWQGKEALWKIKVYLYPKYFCPRRTNFEIH